MQYPHTLIYYPVSTSVKDENGDYTTVAGATSEYKCRAESSDGSGFLTTVDGSRIDYSWQVYFPLSAISLQKGAKVEVYSGEILLLTDTIKRFLPQLMNMRAWL